jgi:hypothetical protein
VYTGYKEDWVGPAVQRIRAKRNCIVVFADDNPFANFGHNCRYFFYDAKSQAFLGETPARFPPYVDWIPLEYELIHSAARPRVHRGREPVVPTAVPPTSAPPVEAPVPSTSVAGTCHAILFGGSGTRRTLNDLEYCYRMLIERGFNPANIHVLYHDGSPKRHVEDGELATEWPDQGDQSAYTIVINGRATRAKFKSVCMEIDQTPLQLGDLVFVHVNGHGDEAGTPAEAYVSGFGDTEYFSSDFCEDLAILRRHASLVIMMEQCCSGRFKDPVIAAKGPGPDQIKADQITIACASDATSFPTDDLLFNQFAQAWIDAQRQMDRQGNAVLSDTSPTNGFVEASEAFAHAQGVAVTDQPVQANVPPTAADIRLA